MDQRESVIENRAEIISVFEKYEVENVRVIGSVARGDYKIDSDIDFQGKLTIDFDGIHKELKQELAPILGFDVDFIDDLSLASAYREKNEREGISIQDFGKQPILDP